MLTQKEIEEESRAAKRSGFEKWLDQPMTRMLVSMIPPGDRPEVVRTALEEAFNNGFDHGAGVTAVSMIKAIMPKPPRTA